MTPLGGGSEEFYSVQEAGCNQLMDSSWIGWHQVEVVSMINLLLSTSLGSMFLWSAVFIWRGSLLPVEAVRLLSVSFRELGGISVILLCARIIV